MKIVKFETWWVKRNKCLFDEKRKGKSSMDWDVVVLKLTTDNGYEGIATALAARSGRVTESYLHDNIAPVVLGASPYDREKIWHELWNIDRHLTFFPVYLPGPVDVALWDICAKAAGLPLYQYIGAYCLYMPAGCSMRTRRSMCGRPSITNPGESTVIKPIPPVPVSWIWKSTRIYARQWDRI